MANPIFTPFYRGDTFVARAIAEITQNNLPLAVSTARMQVRDRVTNELIHEWNSENNPATITFSGAGNNIVTIGKVEPLITQNWKPGNHVTDLEVIFFANGNKLTIPLDPFPILPDTTRD